MIARRDKAGDTATCLECGQESTLVVIDLGIGEYEYWGRRGNHRLPTTVTECCWSQDYGPILSAAERAEMAAIG